MMFPNENLTVAFGAGRNARGDIEIELLFAAFADQSAGSGDLSCPVRNLACFIGHAMQLHAGLVGHLVEHFQKLLFDQGDVGFQPVDKLIAGL